MNDKTETISGQTQDGIGDGKHWEPGLMQAIGERTGFRLLRPGTLNIRVAEPRHDFRVDWQLDQAENRWRHEGVKFQLCSLSRNGRTVPALWMRTTTDHYRDH